MPKKRISIGDRPDLLLTLPEGEWREALERGWVEVDEAETSPSKTTDPPPNGNAKILQAKKIFGLDFLGPEEISKVWGVEINPNSVPPIPFTQPDLIRAKELNQFLILRTSQDSNGKPLTMKRMNQILQPEFTQAEQGKLLYSIDWYKNEPFFAKDTPNPGWALVSKDVIPGTTGKNYLKQTVRLAEYLKTQVFEGQNTPQIYQEALEEFGEEKQAELQQLMNNNWQEATNALSNLKLNQFLRPTPSDVLYDFLAYFRITNKRLLEKMYTWTKARSSDSRLVDLGYFVAYGVYVSRGLPDDCNGDLGVSFSRSL